jgi:hypothetical protein
MAAHLKKAKDQVPFGGYPIKFCFRMEPGLVSKRRKITFAAMRASGVRGLLV